MTVPNGRIPSWMGMVVLCLLASCNDPPPDAPAPPSGIYAAQALGDGLEAPPIKPGLGPPDYWSETFGAYGSPEFWDEYRSTPLDERFDRFGLRLLDYQLREEYLRDHPEVLTRDEQDLYRRLPDAQACRRFIQERSGIQGDQREHRADLSPVSSNTRR